jgi:glycosyltransferase involved in cell wall biosynthesis
MRRADSPLRVLLVAPSLEIVGGQSVQASRIRRELEKEPEIALTFLPINPSLPPFIRSLPYVRTILNFAVFFLTLLARIWQCDLIHVFTASKSSYLMWTVPTILIGKLTRRKVIVNYRDGRAEEHLSQWRTAVPTLRLADAIVAPSGYLVDVFARYNLPALSIFNIIDLSRFRFRERAPLRPVFMTNRGLEPLYNVGCVIRAFAIVQQSYPDASLVIAHDGPCRAELEELARELALKHVQFVGKVPQEHVPGLYNDADIYMMSPNIDNMPGSVLECFASGLPLISTKAGGIPYIVKNGETGLLVDCNNSEAMARCALELLSDPALVTRLTANARRECERYSWSAVREQWLSLYKKVGQVSRPVHRV